MRTKTKKETIELKLGVHLSIAGGIDNVFREANRLGINCFQIFLSSPRIWDVKQPTHKQITVFKEESKKYKFIVVHAPYLVNFATDNILLFEKSVSRVLADIKIMSELGIKFYVIHPGSSSTLNGVERVKKAISLILDTTKEVTILVENLSGERNDVGKNLSELAELVEGFGGRVGLCLDTCHLFASGIDLRDKEQLQSFFDDLESRRLTEKVVMMHANDSKKGLSSGIDRHEHIGMGEIGTVGFYNLLHHYFFASLPFILETPKERDMDQKNLIKLKDLFKMKNI